MQENLNFDTFSELFFNTSKLEFNNTVNQEYRGKGPYFINQKNEVVFDLNPFSDRYSLIGYGHPLKIKSDLFQEKVKVDELEQKIKDSLLPDQNIYIKITNRTKVYTNSIISLSSLKKADEIPTSTSGIFGVSNGWRENINPFLTSHSKILVQNFLPLDFYILNNEDEFIEQEDLNSKDIYYSKLVLNYFLNAPFYREGGRFDQINQLLKKYFSESVFKVENLFVTINIDPKEYLEKLKSFNILAGTKNKKIILSFPTAILEEHIANVHKTIIECLKEGNE